MKNCWAFKNCDKNREAKINQKIVEYIKLMTKKKQNREIKI